MSRKKQQPTPATSLDLAELAAAQVQRELGWKTRRAAPLFDDPTFRKLPLPLQQTYRAWLMVRIQRGPDAYPSCEYIAKLSGNTSHTIVMKGRSKNVPYRRYRKVEEHHRFMIKHGHLAYRGEELRETNERHHLTGKKTGQKTISQVKAHTILLDVNANGSFIMPADFRAYILSRPGPGGARPNSGGARPGAGRKQGPNNQQRLGNQTSGDPPILPTKPLGIRASNHQRLGTNRVSQGVNAPSVHQNEHEGERCALISFSKERSSGQTLDPNAGEQPDKIFDQNLARAPNGPGSSPRDPTACPRVPSGSAVGSADRSGPEAGGLSHPGATEPNERGSGPPDTRPSSPDAFQGRMEPATEWTPRLESNGTGPPHDPQEKRPTRLPSSRAQGETD